MAKTTYSVTRTTNSSGEVQIRMRIYVSRSQRLRLFTGIWVNPSRWGKRNVITIPLTDGQEKDELLAKKELLNNLTSFLEDAINKTIDKSIIDRDWGEKQIQRFYSPPKERKTIERSFFDVSEMYIVTQKMTGQRLKNFGVLMRCLKRFELYKRKIGKSKFKLSFNEITGITLTEFETFLQNEKDVFFKYPDIYEKVPYSTRQHLKSVKRTPKEEQKPKGEPKLRGRNTIVFLMTKLRAFILWAYNNDITRNNPFKSYNIGEEVYGTPIYITIDERKRLYETDLSDKPSLAIQRDIFVFQCLVGCRVSDLYKMTYRSVINGAVEYVPKKTKDERPITVRVPLNQTALEIINRYRDSERDSLLPFISEQKYNKNIKESFKRAGLDRIVTILDSMTLQEVHKPLYEIASSHMARRTFIGNIYKQVKDPNLVGALSGHKEGSKAFARYRDIDEDMKKELISLLG